MVHAMKISWWKWLPYQRWRIIGEVESADEIPDKLPKNAAVVVIASNGPKWIVFDCPCQTGHRIMLNADRSRRPYWTLQKAKRLTIFPSVDFRGTSKRCHYFVRNGKVAWARDSDP